MSNQVHLPEAAGVLASNALHAGLLSRCGAGDQRAFKALWGLLGPQLRKRITRRMVRAADVDDVLAATMDAVWRSATAFKGESSVLTWATAIARRQLPNWNRQALEWDRLLEPDDLDDLLWTDEEASSALQGTQQKGMALRSIHALDKPMQYCVRMHYLQGASLDELATELCVPVGTIKNRLFRARKAMRSWMAQHNAC